MFVKFFNHFDHVEMQTQINTWLNKTDPKILFITQSQKDMINVAIWYDLIEIIVDNPKRNTSEEKIEQRPKTEPTNLKGQLASAIKESKSNSEE